jgi:hypothetical protein
MNQVKSGTVAKVTSTHIFVNAETKPVSMLNIIPDWNEETLYHAGDIVRYEGRWYKRIGSDKKMPADQVVHPTDPDHWEEFKNYHKPSSWQANKKSNRGDAVAKYKYYRLTEPESKNIDPEDLTDWEQVKKEDLPKMDIQPWDPNRTYMLKPVSKRTNEDGEIVDDEDIPTITVDGKKYNANSAVVKVLDAFYERISKPKPGETFKIRQKDGTEIRAKNPPIGRKDHWRRLTSNEREPHPGQVIIDKNGHTVGNSEAPRDIIEKEKSFLHSKRKAEIIKSILVKLLELNEDFILVKRDGKDEILDKDKINWKATKPLLTDDDHNKNKKELRLKKSFDMSGLLNDLQTKEEETENE